MKSLLLPGLDGSNPLAFLAAIGTLRVVTPWYPAEPPRMKWRLEHGIWVPALVLPEEQEPRHFASQLAKKLKRRANQPELNLGLNAKNLTVGDSKFRCFQKSAVDIATRKNRDTADFAAAYGCAGVLRDDGKIQDTELRTMSGAGHQHFLVTMQKIVSKTDAEHIYQSLFEPWRYDDPLKNLSMRWDPAGDRHHAYQWVSPTEDKTRSRSGSMLGANRLAIEGLPSLASAPDGMQLRTPGFVNGRKRGSVTWNWPIWDSPCSLAVIESILRHPALGRENPNIDELYHLGIIAVYQTQRLTTGMYRNFTPAKRIA